MTFYGKDPEPKTTPRLKTFKFRTGGDLTEPREVEAQHVYFYDSGHIGFWNDAEDDRVLVLAVKALDVWEEPA